jgi:hypothetical protein
VRIDTLALRMRPRAPLEAADLGARLCQTTARSVYFCYAVAYLPVLALALASFEIAAWVPSVLLFWAKPWLDRTVVFVLSRAAFGQATTVGDLWRAQGAVWWRHWWLTWTWRRLSPWRAFTQPVYQLEGLSLWRIRRRVQQIKSRKRGSALLMMLAFLFAEICLVLTILSLLWWFAPPNEAPDLLTMMFEGATFFSGAAFASYAIAVAFLHPFYVAAGFAMYLNRRAELEAWDVEQELRRAFAT